MDELTWTVVPSFDPPDVEAWVANSISQAMLQEPHRRAYLWANWLLKQAAGKETEKVGPTITAAINAAFTGQFEISDITAGFIPVQSNTKRDVYLSLMKRNERRTHSYDANGFFWTFGLVVGVRPYVPGQSLTEKPAPSAFSDFDGFPVMCEQRLDAEIVAKATAFHAGASVRASDLDLLREASLG